MQDDIPIAYYSKKLNSAQKNYNTCKKELLLLVMTLMEYCSMLLDVEISIYSDHKNLAFGKLSSQRVLRWHCYCDEYNLTIKRIAGK